ncbi:MAG: response regulator [Candidatus Aminicenantes bacterium]|nr:MAG: response regulator [Candidatus Aminicenantes bacterium]
MAYKLIIAHDSPSIQKAIHMAFPASKFDLIIFEEGTDIMKALSQIKPDAVLLNLSLFQKDGYKIGRFLKGREEFKQTSLFLLKGAFEPLDAEKMAGLEYDKIIEEPFDSEKLAEMVQDTIEGKKDPQTLPEEPLPKETHVAPQAVELEPKKFDPGTSSPESRPKAGTHAPAASNELDAGKEEKLRSIVRQEILEVERELEKRLKTQVFVEIKEWVEQELDRIRKLLGHTE